MSPNVQNSEKGCPQYSVLNFFGFRSKFFSQCGHRYGADIKLSHRRVGFCDGSAATAHAGDAECNQAIQCMWVLEYGMWAKNRPQTKVVELNEGYPAMQSVWQLLCSLRRKTQNKKTCKCLCIKGVTQNRVFKAWECHTGRGKALVSKNAMENLLESLQKGYICHPVTVFIISEMV